VSAANEQTAMDRYVAGFKNRDEMAVEYARIMREQGLQHAYLPLNLAIMDRWSKSGLEYIKTKAWKLAAAPKK